MDVERQVDAFNAKYPAGTRVEYYRVMIPGEEPTETETEGTAFVLGGHTAVIKLKAFSDVRALRNIRLSSVDS